MVLLVMLTLHESQELAMLVYLIKTIMSTETARVHANVPCHGGWSTLPSCPRGLIAERNGLKGSANDIGCIGSVGNGWNTAIEVGAATGSLDDAFVVPFGRQYNRELSA